MNTTALLARGGAHWIIAALATAMGTAPAKAADEHAWPGNEDLRHLRLYGDPQVSPDGSAVLLNVREPTADGARRHVWLLDPKGGAPRQLTVSPEKDTDGESSARWMPDGHSLLFIAHRGERAELFQLSMLGGDAQPLAIEVPVTVDDSRANDALPPHYQTSAPATAATTPAPTLPVEVKSFGVNAGGDWLWVIGDDPVTPGEKAQLDAKADANWVDHETHGTHLYLWNTVTHQATAVPLHDDVAEAAWNPDGARLAIVTQAPHRESDLEPTRHAWLVSVAQPGNPQALAEIPRAAGTLQWDVAGRELYFYSQARRDAPPGYPDLYVDELATHRVRNLSDGLDGTPLGNIVPLPDGGVVVSIARGFDWTLERYGGGGGGALRQSPGTVSALATNAAHSAWTWIESRSGHAPEVWYATSPGAPGQRLNAPPFHASGVRRSAEARRVQWKFEGRMLQGLLYMPGATGANAAAGTHMRVPLVVEGHGGPTWAFNDEFSPWVDYLVGQGWAVFRPNPRGSTMRGAAFAAANKNDLGGGDVRDILAGVDHVLKHYPLEATRMAFIGYSYGGELAGFMEGQTTRFRALVSGAPVIDQFSEYGTEDDSYYDRWFYGYPWQHFADAWRQSPLAGVGKQQGGTPMLLIQGLEDESDPAGQSYEMYRALRQAHVPVELVTYPREGHSTLARGTEGEPSKEPWHGFEARRHIVAFIKAHFRD